jgi:hypothetical protein
VALMGFSGFARETSSGGDGGHGLGRWCECTWVAGLSNNQGC